MVMKVFVVSEVLMLLVMVQGLGVVGYPLVRCRYLAHVVSVVGVDDS
jgi:hypothetical protein